jgi:DMATS type aromatic prenyltransferase
MVAADASLLSDHVIRRIVPLCDVLSLDARECVATFRDVVAPCTNLRSSWVSEISDDNTPIELSVTFDRDTAALRVLFEPQADAPTLDAFRASGLAFLERLGARSGADLTRLRRIQDLFLPEGMQGRFAVWSSVVFERGEAPAYKVYLNPGAQGRGLAPTVVEEALARLDMPHAWANLCEAAMQRGAYLDEIKYFALDLSPGEHARVKVYVHHHGATAADLEAACSHSKNYAPSAVLAFARAMRGGDARMTARAPFTCHAFTSASAARATTTAYIPVCAYARDDSEVFRRHVAYLEACGIETDMYRRIVVDAAPRSLDAGIGLQSWIALRSDAECPRMTVYLATEARRVYAPGSVPAPSPDPLAVDTPDAAIALLAERPLDAHPVLRRMVRRRQIDFATLRAIVDVHRSMWRALDQLYRTDCEP